MKWFNTKFFLFVIIALSGLVYSAQASASYNICLVKEISNDGVTYYDANTQADAVPISDSAFFRFTVSKCPEDPGGLIDIVLTDPSLDLTVTSLEDLPHSHSEYPDRIYTLEVTDYCSGHQGYKENVASVTGTIVTGLDTRTDTDNAWAYCEDIPQGGDGCTPGYWKQPHHFDSWPQPPYPYTSFETVFGVDIDINSKVDDGNGDVSFIEALNAKGGKVNMAARHAAAAYLNAASGGVSYDLSTQAVIDIFQSALSSKNYNTVIQTLVEFNEQGCPLN